MDKKLKILDRYLVIIPIPFFIFTLLTFLFCFVGLPIVLYFTAVFKIDYAIATSVYSINWTIFGILVAIISTCIAFYHKLPNYKRKPLLLFSEISVVLGLVLVCLQLSFTSVIIFSGDDKLYYSMVFSTLYFISLLFIHLFGALLYILMSFLRTRLQNESDTDFINDKQQTF